MKRAFVVRSSSPACLEASYARALRLEGVEVDTFDLSATVKSSTPVPTFGTWLARVLPSAMHSANRQLALKAEAFDPDVVILAIRPDLSPGSLAYIRSMRPNAKLVCLWPDPLVNLARELVPLLPLLDLVCTYSKATIPVFERFGLRTMFLPFAGDPELHRIEEVSLEEQKEFGSDISFAGGYRPEREEALRCLIDAFPEASIKIWGPSWDRRCNDKRVLSKWTRRAPEGNDFAKILRSSRVNLNVTDHTNGPGANMRFFEIPMAGGLQLARYCGEMADEFQHGKHVLYYRSLNEAIKITRDVLHGSIDEKSIRAEGHDLVQREHTYQARARTLLAGL